MQTFWSILGLILLGTLAGRVIVARRRERRALKPLAAEHHLHYAHEDLIGLQERYQNLLLIRRGHNRHFSHLLYGSSAEGPITLFCYTYELGFGAKSESRQWWVAVVETARACRGWRMEPADAPADPLGDTPEVSDQAIDGYRLWASSPDTSLRLRAAEVGQLFENAPAGCCWEVQGPLAAVAVPFNLDPQTPRRLFDSVCRLVRFLKEHDLGEARDPDAMLGEASP